MLKEKERERERERERELSRMTKGFRLLQCHCESSPLSSSSSNFSLFPPFFCDRFFCVCQTWGVQAKEKVGATFPTLSRSFSTFRLVSSSFHPRSISPIAVLQSTAKNQLFLRPPLPPPNSRSSSRRREQMRWLLLCCSHLGVEACRRKRTGSDGRRRRRRE